MSKLRSIDTCIWSDPWFEDLGPQEKLLFIYLITNEKTNMLGVYEATDKKISFETDITLSSVREILSSFIQKNKVKRQGNFLIMINFLKHQRFNVNMKKSAIDVYNSLPKELRIAGDQLDKDNYAKDWVILCKAYGNHTETLPKVEDEVEDEVETKLEDEDELEFPPEVPSEEKIIDNSSFLKNAKESSQWIETIAMQQSVSVLTIQEFLIQFDRHLVAMQEQKDSLKDYKQHFVHWIKKQDLSSFARKPIGKTNQLQKSRKDWEPTNQVSYGR